MTAAGPINAIQEMQTMRNELSHLLCRSGDLERSAGRFESAMDCYRRAAILVQQPARPTSVQPAVGVSPSGSPDLYTGLGEQALVAGDHEAATIYFLRALSTCEQSPRAYRGLAIVHTRCGRPGAARAAARRAHQLEAGRVTSALESASATVRQIRQTAVMLSRYRAVAATDLATDELPTALLADSAERYRTTKLEVPAARHTAARSSAA